MSPFPVGLSVPLNIQDQGGNRKFDSFIPLVKYNVLISKKKNPAIFFSLPTVVVGGMYLQKVSEYQHVSVFWVSDKCSVKLRISPIV